MKSFQYYLEAAKNQNKKLWLDDERLPIESNWVVVQNQKEFENAVRKNRWLRFSEFSFDNDLGTGNGSGYDCAWFLINEILDYIAMQPKNETLKLNLKIRIHSHNPVASKQIYSLFNNFFKAQKEDGSIAQESIMELILLPAIYKKEFFIHNKIISLAIRKSIASVYKQGISCGIEDCSDASAAFVYHANTGKTVLDGITEKWNDGESGPWYLAYVEVNGAPHNVAYNNKTKIIVDLTLGQFKNYKDLKAVILQKENYLSLINSEVFNIQKYTISDTLQVLYKKLKR
jgi:hypothetical protein